jgi:predicted RNA-binding protein
MCESSVYVRLQTGDDKLLADDIARIVPEGELIRIWSVLGEETWVKGTIIEIDLMSHRVVVRESPEE